MNKTKTRPVATIAEKKDSFFKFLRKHRYQLLGVFVFYIAVYFILTSLYPDPNGITDSGSYVNAAFKNKYDGYRPYGYSEFLAGMHKISPSLSSIVFVQFWLNAFCTTFFVFSIKYFFRAKNRIIDLVYMAFSIASVITIYLTNTVLSDSLFTSLTMLWATFGLWFIGSGSLRLKSMNFFLHIFVMGLLINIRFTGFFYASVTLMLIIFTFFRKDRMAGVGLTLALVLLTSLFYNNQIKNNIKLTGISTFGGFSGWQSASNALYVLPHIELNENDFEDPEVKQMVQFIKNYDTVIDQLANEPIHAYMMWDKKGPLKGYMQEYRKTHRCYIVYAWTYLGENVYSKFASQVIWSHPMLYFKHFLLPNFWENIYPKNDLIYTRFKADAIPPVLLKQWFRITNKTKLDPGSEIVRKIGVYLPFCRMLIWLMVFTAVLLYLFVRKKTGWVGSQVNSFWFLVLFVLGYLGFHTLSVPFELRYIAPVHVMQIAILYIVVNILLNRKNNAALQEQGSK